MLVRWPLFIPTMALPGHTTSSLFSALHPLHRVLTHCLTVVPHLLRRTMTIIYAGAGSLFRRILCELNLCWTWFSAFLALSHLVFRLSCKDTLYCSGRPPGSDASHSTCVSELFTKFLITMQGVFHQREGTVPRPFARRFIDEIDN